MSKEQVLFPTIKINKTENGLFIYIETPRLIIRSLLEEDYESHKKIIGNPVAMEKYATGDIQTDDTLIRERFNGWLKKWKEKDPFSRYSVLLKDNTKEEYIGRVTLEADETPGHSELEYIFDPAFWGKGYAIEAISALILHLVPKLVELEFLRGNVPLSNFVATAREDNPASWKILKRIGFKETKPSEKFGAMRLFYSFDVVQLCRNRYSFFQTELCNGSEQEEHLQKQWSQVSNQFNRYPFFQEVCGGSEPEHVQKQWDTIFNR